MEQDREAMNLADEAKTERPLGNALGLHRPPSSRGFMQSRRSGRSLFWWVLRTPLLDPSPWPLGIKITGCQSPSGEDTGTHPAYALLTPPSTANPAVSFGRTKRPSPELRGERRVDTPAERLHRGTRPHVACPTTLPRDRKRGIPGGDTGRSLPKGVAMKKLTDLPPMPATPVTDAELTVLLRYREGTTPGWTLEAPPKGPDKPRAILATSLCEWEEADGWCGPSYGQVALFGYEGNIEADLMFCFLAHQQVPDLIAELRALREENKYLTDYCGELMLECAQFNGFITTRGPDGKA